MKIIVLDGDGTFKGLFESRCREAGVDSEFFADGATGLATVKKNPEVVSLLLVSRELSNGQDGLALAQLIRTDALLKDVPFILMSNVWSKGDFAKHQRSEFGANAYYSKSAAIGELISTIEAVLGEKFSAPLANSVMPADVSATKQMDLSPVDLSNVSLKPVHDVVNLAEKIPDGIQMEEPISLSGVVGNAPVAPVKKEVTKQAVEKTRPTIDVAELSRPTPVQIMLSTQKESNAGNLTSIQLEMAPTENVSVSGPQEVSLNLTFETSANVPLASAPEVAPATANNVPEQILSSEKVAPMVQLEAVSPTDAVVVTPAESSVDQVAVPVSEDEAARDLPYLFSGQGSNVPLSRNTTTLQRISEIDSRGTEGGQDLETMKKYLFMREQDISVLTVQLTYAKEELRKSEDTIKRLSLENEDLSHQMSGLKEKLGKQEQELQHAGKMLQSEVEHIGSELRAKNDRVKFLEERLSDSAEQYEKLKDRVRLDIRKIRVREKELESKLEILKRDSETLIAAREGKILELKRKIDLLEFNFDTLQDRNEQEKENTRKHQGKLDRVMKVLKLAMGVIDTDISNSIDSEEKPNDRDSRAKVA